MMYVIQAAHAAIKQEIVEWHLGEPIPEAAKDRVVTFQADGDELEMILAAMRASIKDVMSPVLSRTRLLVARDSYLKMEGQELSLQGRTHACKQLELIENLLTIISEGV